MALREGRKVFGVDLFNNLDILKPMFSQGTERSLSAGKANATLDIDAGLSSPLKRLEFSDSFDTNHVAATHIIEELNSHFNTDAHRFCREFHVHPWSQGEVLAVTAFVREYEFEIVRSLVDKVKRQGFRRCESGIGQA